MLSSCLPSLEERDMYTPVPAAPASDTGGGRVQMVFRAPSNRPSAVCGPKRFSRVRPLDLIFYVMMVGFGQCTTFRKDLDWPFLMILFRREFRSYRFPRLRLVKKHKRTPKQCHEPGPLFLTSPHYKLSNINRKT